LSRVFNGIEVTPLKENSLFGQIPQLSNEEIQKSKRLSDQIGLLKEKGYQEGYQAGYQNGLLMGTAEGKKIGFQQAMEIAAEERNQESSQFILDVETMREEFEQAAIQWFENAEEKLTDLAMEAVKKVVAAELQINRTVALQIAQEIMSELTNANQARIRINPNDFALFESHREELSRHSLHVKGIEFVPDHSIGSGVIVETESGVLNATVETRLMLLESEFNEAA
jgi:flagellar assembly protein FliH